MKKIILLTTILCSSIPAMAETLRLSVPGMVCQMCVQGMRKTFKKDVKGKADQKIIVDLEKKYVFLNELKEGALDTKSAILKTPNTGYHARVAQLGSTAAVTLPMGKIKVDEIKKRLSSEKIFNFVKVEKIKAGKDEFDYVEIKLKEDIDWEKIVKMLEKIFPEIKV